MMDIMTTHNLPNTVCAAVPFCPSSCSAPIKNALIAKKKCSRIKGDVLNKKLKFITVNPNAMFAREPGSDVESLCINKTGNKPSY